MSKLSLVSLSLYFLQIIFYKGFRKIQLISKGILKLSQNVNVSISDLSTIDFELNSSD